MDSPTSPPGSPPDEYFPAPGDPTFWPSPAHPSSSNAENITFSHPPQTPTPMGFNHHYATRMGYPGTHQTQMNHGYAHYGTYYHPGHYLPPLQPTQSTTLNAAPSPAAAPEENQRKRKKRGTDGSQTQKPVKRVRRARTTATVTDENLPPIQAAAHCGVGPAEPPASSAGPSTASTLPTGSPSSNPPLGPPPPLHSFTADVRETLGSRGSEGSKSAALDVFYFLRALDVDTEPVVHPDPEKEPHLTKNPGKKVKFVGCKLCKRWKVWNHGDGMTPTYRAHLTTHHLPIYERTVQELGLKNSKKQASTSDHSPFVLKQFYHLLMKFIAVDDQSINVVECPEFRELLSYIGNENIEDDDIPHWTKITQMIFEEHQKIRTQIEGELRRALGRVAYTFTAHFYIRENGRLVLRTYLVAFRHVTGSHTGTNLAQVFFTIVDELGVAYRISLITMDNASNNNTMMEAIARICRSRNIPFDADGSRVRCFPHIINLACQAILDALKLDDALGLFPETDPATKIYLRSLETDLVGTCRTVVAACRASGQRREELRRIILDGNEKDTWEGELPENEKYLRLLQLLRDCETRWSSTFLMIERMIYLYPAVRRFLNNVDQTDLSHHLFSHQQLNILRDIHQVLEIPHRAQELLSAERTPTLSLSLPLYEILIDEWKRLRVTIPELAPHINVGIQKLEDYVGLARRTQIYAHAMVLNPGMKFKWMEEHWEEEDIQQAREWVKESMLKYQTSSRHQNTRSTTTTSSGSLGRSLSAPSIAARSQGRGYARLTGIDVSVRRSTSMTSGASRAPSSPPAGTPPVPEHEPTPEELVDQEARAVHKGERIVEQEMKRYINDGVSETTERISDLTREWERNEHSYPLLFRVAMDVLPVQASAVPCERVFSSSKETCGLRQSKLSPKLMEALQMLKFSFKQERLSFTGDLIADEKDYTIIGPVTGAAVAELLEAGKLQELEELLSNTDDNL